MLPDWHIFDLGSKERKLNVAFNSRCFIKKVATWNISSFDDLNWMLLTKLTGRYHIISHLGGGGFGATYIAEDTQLPDKPHCVVKQLKPQASDPLTLQTARRLFDTEAQVLYQLGTHDRIPRLLAYFEENQEFYLVQEFIKGVDLSQELTPETKLSEDTVISLLQEILEILQFVHAQKVIHRDINPRNLLRREADGKLILIDFGAVKQIATQTIPLGGTVKLTVAIGTPGYVPSEQAHGNPKYSSDIYATGIVAIQALTGLSPEQLVKDVDTDEIIWQDCATVSPELAEIIDKMVCYDFRVRYPSAEAALQALKNLKNPTVTIALAPAGKKNKNKWPKAFRKKIRWQKVLLAVGIISVGLVSSLFILNALHSANAVELYKQANTLYDLKRYSEAIATYNQALQLNPNYLPALIGQGKSLYELKQYPASLALYEKAIQIQPQYLEAWSGRGFVLHKLQRDEEALASFDKATQIQNNHPEIWQARGNTLLDLKQYTEAIKSYEKVLELKQDDYETWNNKGWCLHNLHRYEEAIAAYDKATELKSDYDKAWYNKGNSLINLRRYQDAIAAYDKALQSQPKNDRAWFSRGNALINLQKYPEAIESFNQATTINANDYEAWYNKGWLFHKMQRDEEAVTAYDRAIQLKRDDYQTWYNRGNSYYSLKKYVEALASYNKAVHYKADHAESWYSRGNAQFSLQRYPDAIASYEKAIRLNPNYQAATNAKNQAQSFLLVEKIKEKLKI